MWTLDALNNKFAQFIEYLKVSGYKKNTIRIKRKVINAFFKACKEKNLTEVSFTEINQIFADIKSKISKSYQCHVSAIEGQLSWWLLDQPSKDFIQEIKDYSDLPEKEWFLVKEYILYLQSLKTNTMAIKRTARALIRFLRWLIEKHKNFDEITFSIFEIYLENNKQIVAPHSISSTLSNIKRFYKWCYITNKTKAPLFERIPTGIKTNYVSEQHIWTRDELNLLLKTVLLNGPLGIRDFAILMLAIRLSLRSVDIANLKLDDINWKSGELKFIQQKTKNLNSFIIPKDVAWALINYLKIRPKVDSRYIFLTNRPPFRPFAFSVSGIIFPYLKKAGIPYGKNLPNKGIHSLRHTLATLLLKEEIPLPVISSILGHSNIESTKTYIKEDVEHLRLCCIDLEKELLNV